jgi:glutathionylspermidine synthase
MTPEMRIGSSFDLSLYNALTERAVLECFKWNLGAGDRPTLCPYPIILSLEQWKRLAALAETLDRESQEAERELLGRPDLQARLGFPKRTELHLQRAIWSDAPRYTRFDFHIAREGFRITESNCDVAGGLLEASGVGAVVSRLLGRPSLLDPAGVYANAFVQQFGRGARIGLAHLGRYSEDRQVALYLKKRLEEHGLTAQLFEPAQLRPSLRAVTASGEVELTALYRFFPGDWLEQLPKATGWPELFQSDRVSNPLSTMLVQSKRFPLIWDELKCHLPTWRQLLPETREPDDHLVADAEWVLKPALGHEGANILMEGATPKSAVAALRRGIRRNPGRWIAQRRFRMVPLETPDGPRFVCVGVFVVQGKAAGVYTRLSNRPVIDDAAQEAIALVGES